jgi:hypothetical protein
LELAVWLDFGHKSDLYSSPQNKNGFSVVNDTFEKYRNDTDIILAKKSIVDTDISAISSNLKSIADTDTDTFVYDFSTTGDIRRRISGNTAVRYTAVTGTYSYTTVKKPL